VLVGLFSLNVKAGHGPCGMPTKGSICFHDVFFRIWM
jgi:hypothetical protein